MYCQFWPIPDRIECVQCYHCKSSAVGQLRRVLQYTVLISCHCQLLWKHTWSHTCWRPVARARRRLSDPASCSVARLRRSLAAVRVIVSRSIGLFVPQTHRHTTRAAAVSSASCRVPLWPAYNLSVHSAVAAVTWSCLLIAVAVISLLPCLSSASSMSRTANFCG